MEEKNWFWKIFDQVAHFSIGAFSVFLLMLPVIIWFREYRLLVILAFAIVMTVAYWREMRQHPGQCNSGCIMDLTFWALGAGSMSAVIFFILDSLKYVI